MNRLSLDFNTAMSSQKGELIYGKQLAVLSGTKNGATLDALAINFKSRTPLFKPP